MHIVFILVIQAMNAVNGRKVECTKKTTTIPIVVDNDVEREKEISVRLRYLNDFSKRRIDIQLCLNPWNRLGNVDSTFFETLRTCN